MREEIGIDMDMIKILDLWVEVTGVSPNDSVVRIRDLDIRRANEIIKNSLNYDSTYITTLMLLKSYLEDFISDRSILLKDIIEDYDTFTAWLDKINLLKNLITSQEAEEVKSAFKESLKQAIQHYKIEEAIIHSMVEDERNLAELRYSAFNAINELDVYQFSDGVPSTKKPVIYEKVYLFHNVNTLLQWMMSVDSGIVLAMIQNPEQLSSSYFVFAIRNGGKLYLVTDREKTAHPLQQSLSRSRARGRAFYNRITEYFFPYSLMDIEFGDNHRAYVKSNTTQLATNDGVASEGVALKEIRHLEPDEIVWLVMMFSLLNDKFFKEHYRAEKLAYTPQMMLETNYLPAKAEQYGIVLYGYQPLVVETLTKESIKTEKVKDAFDYKPTGQHDWMIDRYHIPDEVLDVLQNPQNKTLYLTDGSKESKLPVTVEKMSNLDFADAERLQKDRIYLARYNMAKAINVQLREEYEKRKDEVIDWYRNAIRRNLPTLLKAIVTGKFIVSKDKNQACIKDGDWLTPQSDGNILRVGELKGESYQGHVRCVIGGESTTYNHITCVVNDSKASLVGHFHPRTASMLADLCGCDVSDLHELLRYWQKEKISLANHILDRVDPMDWAINNPWEWLNLDVRIYLSKSGFNALCKQYGVENSKFWLKKESNDQ